MRDGGREVIPYLREITAVVVLVVLTFIGWSLYSWGHGNGAAKVQARWDKERADLMAEYARDMADARERERQLTEHMAEVAAIYEKDRQDAQAAADAVVADLRAGNIRLHQRWQAAIATRDLSRAAAAPGEPDAAADDRDAAAARIVRAGAVADAQIRGLQAVIRSYRGEQ